MNFLFYLICGFVAAFIQAFFKGAGISLGAIPTVLLYGAAFWVARQLIKRHEVKTFYREVARTSWTPFEYAKRFVPSSVIEYCEANLDQPTYVVTGYLDRLVHDKVLKRPCADVLIRGYAAIMNDRKKQAPTAGMVETPMPTVAQPATSTYSQQPPIYNSHQRFCEYCGNPIDGVTNRCTGCGKQHFKLADYRLFAVAAVIILALVGWIIFDGIQDDNDAAAGVGDLPVATKPEETMPAQVPRPLSGKVLFGSTSGESEITITASAGEDCVVSLKSVKGITKLAFYVRAGDTVTVRVPSGHFYVYFASGEEWYGYGEGLMFGKYTSYSKDDDLLDFVNYTWEYTLYPVNNGNFSETPIDESEFFD